MWNEIIISSELSGSTSQQCDAANLLDQHARRDAHRRGVKTRIFGSSETARL